jgi:LysR family transcriptional regulator, low CO2-responsive transcriptional regulator
MLRRFRYTLHQLRIFLAVAEHGGISRAAAVLHLAQPTVSMQVRQLGDALGATLLEARGRTLCPTAAGREVLDVARAMLRSAETLEERLAAIEGLTRGRLRLTVASTAEYFVPRLLGAFQKAHPGVTGELRVVNRAEVVARLREDVDDLYVMAQPPSEEPVVADPVVDNPLVVIAAPAHPLAARRQIALAELVAHDFVVRESGAGTRLIADSFLARHDLVLPTRLELGSNEAVKQAVIGGLGLAVISMHALRNELSHHRRLRVLPVEGFPIPSRWHCVRRADRAPTRIAGAFQAFLCAAAPELGADLARLMAPRASRRRAPTGSAGKRQ